MVFADEHINSCGSESIKVLKISLISTMMIMLARGAVYNSIFNCVLGLMLLFILERVFLWKIMISGSTIRISRRSQTDRSRGWQKCRYEQLSCIDFERQCFYNVNRLTNTGTLYGFLFFRSRVHNNKNGEVHEQTRSGYSEKNHRGQLHKSENPCGNNRSFAQSSKPFSLDRKSVV